MNPQTHERRERLVSRRALTKAAVVLGVFLVLIPIALVLNPGKDSAFREFLFTEPLTAAVYFIIGVLVVLIPIVLMRFIRG